MNKETKTVAIIVAHPDDETLWCGGTVLSNPSWLCFIASMCRKNDPDRAPKFEIVRKILGADGIMGDLDDGPEQKPLPEHEVEEAIMSLLPSNEFDLVITHSIYGEYTRHLRHQEIGKAVINLWHSGKLNTSELWAFAYEDGHREYTPVAINDAPVFFTLPHYLWEQKYSIITNTYGFNINSWEAQTTPMEEAYWQFFNAEQARQWLISGNSIP
ncbi:MAG: family deacetylase [Mucilaginibacter sp.]|nr:family deacetylase [Mucilaginibacter sp.]